MKNSSQRSENMVQLLVPITYLRPVAYWNLASVRVNVYIRTLNP